MKNTKIQWCDSTINPVMGCNGCELWPKPATIVAELVKKLASMDLPAGIDVSKLVKSTVGDRTTSELYRDRKVIAARLQQEVSL